MKRVRMIVGLLVLSLGYWGYRKAIEKDADLRFGFNIIKDGNASLVIFVHGLGGDSTMTWQSERNPTWMEFFAQDPVISNSRILSVSYPSGIFGAKWNRTALAKKLAQDLKEQGKNFNQITIIAHSLGGLLARHTLVVSDPQIIEQKFVTLISLGSPFGGSEIAKLASKLPINLVNGQVAGLTGQDDGITMLEDEWTKFVASMGERLQQYAVCEMTMVPSLPSLVVEANSALKGVPPQNTYHASGKNHLQLAKCVPEDALYQRVRKWVLQAIGSRSFSGTNVIAGDMKVPAGATVNISKGSTLIFKDGGCLSSEGKIVAVGTEAEPIRFIFSKPDSGSNGLGLLLRGNGANNSSFEFCHFEGGSGLGLKKGEPAKAKSREDWVNGISVTSDPAKQEGFTRYGGALLLIDTDNVDFRNCVFTNNEAWMGGAVALLGTSRSDFDDCLFSLNRSAFGGGAIFSQWSHFYVQNSTLLENQSGFPSQSVSAGAEKRLKYACGGAVYLGEVSSAEFTGCKWSSNRAKYVGGGLYAFGTHVRQLAERPSLLVKCSFTNNLGAAEMNGSAIWLDGLTRMDVTELSVDSQLVEGDPLPKSVWNESVQADSVGAPSGMKLNRVLASRSKEGIQVIDAPMENPRSFKIGRRIDTIVIHHISAIHWLNPQFQEQNKEPIQKFMSNPEMAERVNSNTYKYDWRFCKQILEIYGFSAHYLIDRDGVVRRLVNDEDIAYHAGESLMPSGDDRHDVNQFSIGIELIASHPDDDSDVKEGKIPAYTEAQYQSLAVLVDSLKKKYKDQIKSVVGHDEIAGTRAVELKVRSSEKLKKDPGPMFNWSRVRPVSNVKRTDTSTPSAVDK